MSLVRSKDTKPELLLRRLIDDIGYRYQTHIRELPGTPDFVFARRKKVVFIHGCFWHQHKCPSGDRIPKSRIEFWLQKLNGNVKRDRKTLAKLRRLGFRALIIWECQMNDLPRIRRRLVRFLAK